MLAFWLWRPQTSRSLQPTSAADKCPLISSKATDNLASSNYVLDTMYFFHLIFRICLWLQFYQSIFVHVLIRSLFLGMRSILPILSLCNTGTAIFRQKEISLNNVMKNVFTHNDL